MSNHKFTSKEWVEIAGFSFVAGAALWWLYHQANNSSGVSSGGASPSSSTTASTPSVATTEPSSISQPGDTSNPFTVPDMANTPITVPAETYPSLTLPKIASIGAPPITLPNGTTPGTSDNCGCGCGPGSTVSPTISQIVANANASLQAIQNNQAATLAYIANDATSLEEPFIHYEVVTSGE